MGFDFLCIDAEHNAIQLETIQKMLQGLKATPTYGMVRIPTLSYEYVSGTLDIGADALLIPQIRTMDDILRLKEFSQYPPIGRRGCGPSRLWDYGDGIMQLAGQADRNCTTNIVVQLETVQAVEHIDEIVKSDFIDMFFIGPGDLSMDMGIFGQFGNPRLTDTILMLREKTAAAGKRLGIFAGSFEAAQSWYQKGFDMCIVNSELGLMGAAISGDMGFQGLLSAMERLRGQQPSACTEISRGSRSMKPMAYRSFRPFQVPAMVQPSPTEIAR